MLPKICSIPDCETKTLHRGLCNSHHKRFLRHGDPLAGGAFRDRRPIPERFQANHIEEPGACWDWLGEINADGYGVMRQKKTTLAHRYSFGIANKVEDFGEIDHQCRNRACVNPDHLREVTRPQNSQNQATLRPTKSGYRGVAWHAFSKSWHVIATYRGRQHSGGYFKDVHEAGRAAIELRNKLYTHNEEDRRLAA